MRVDPAESTSTVWSIYRKNVSLPPTWLDMTDLGRPTDAHFAPKQGGRHGVVKFSIKFVHM